VLILFSGGEALAQNSQPLERLLGIPAKQRPAPPLPTPEGFPDHIVGGKLVLSLEDSIRLALVNNTDIRLDNSATEFAQNNVFRQYQLFDPLFQASFNDQRSQTPASTQLQGASILNTLTQTTTFGYSQTFASGTNFQTNFSFNKYSTNSSFSFLNPAIPTTLQFQVTQPLLKNLGLFANRAPILIAQRNLKQAQSAFQAEVNDILLLTIDGYWNVVLAREALVVQKKSYDEAQKSYDHDKKALSLGALPPLDIYRSESQVASRRVGLIQSEYSLKQAEDQFRQFIGADRDPAIRALDIELNEDFRPAGALAEIDIATALSRALANRSEFDSARQMLASDEMNIRLAHNNIRPDLELSGSYATNGLGGNEYNTAVPPVIISTGGLGESINQMFHFNYPTYWLTLSLRLPIKNHSAEANLGDALVTRTHDQYQEEKTRQTITLEVTNAVHQLEESKLSLEAARVAVDLAEKSLHAEERKYELGSSTVFFVLDAQTQLAQAEFSLAQAETGYQTAVAQVEHATGELLSRYHVQLAPRHK
jgi:HAE1 family hydrophobic/amphiphilic exporter-1